MNEREATTPIVKIDLSAITTVIFILIILMTVFRHVINSLLLGEVSSLVITTIPAWIIGLWYFLDIPRSRIHKNKLVQLNDIHPDLNEKIRLLTSAIGIKKAITVFLWPLSKINAFAFGTWNHQYIAISEGAIAGLPPEELDALIHHELSHLKSGDHWKFELARLMTIVYVLFATFNQIMALFTNIQKYHGSLVLPEIASGISYSLFLVVVVGVIYLLRIREYNADLSVIQQMDRRSPLIKAILHINKLTTMEPTKTIAPPMSIWGKQGLFHPSYISRLKIINNSDGLQQEIYPLTIWVGLAFAVLVCGPGDLDVVIKYTIPLILTIGFPILFMLNAYRTYLDTTDFRIPSFINCFKISLIFNSMVALVTLLATIPWGILDPDYAESGVHLINKSFLTHRLGLLLDNQFLIMTIVIIAVALMLYIVSATVFEIRSWGRLDIRRQTLAAWGISLPISIPTSILWIMAVNGSLSSFLWLVAIPGIFIIWTLVLFLLSRIKKQN